jgi:hypothetical protein
MRSVLIVHHRVADFDAWRAVYESEPVGQMQRAAGVRDHAVMRPADDPTMVVVVHTFDSPEAAASFMERDDLREHMGRAGVDPESIQAEILQEEVAGRLSP